MQADRYARAGAATNMATPAACAVPITVCMLCWAKTRSIATAVGRCSVIQASTACSISDQPAGGVELGRGAHHVDRDQPRLAAGHTVDHAETAPGQTRVDAEHPHAITPRSA